MSISTLSQALLSVSIAACMATPAHAQWHQTAKLLPNDGSGFEEFGLSVAISGRIAIVSAHGDDDLGPNSGAAYLFESTSGAQVAKLLPDDYTGGFWFGYSVGVSDGTAVVGAKFYEDNGYGSGAAYLFDAATGMQIAKLVPSDNAAHDYFGGSVAISGDTAIIGANGDDDNGSYSGAAYLFNATTGDQIAKLLPVDGAADDRFGCSVGISGAIAIVGARGDDDNGSSSGAAYLFDTTTGAQIVKLLPEDGAMSAQFGYSVAISGTTAIVGAWLDSDNGAESGAAYLFDVTTGAQLAKLLPADGAEGDLFGSSVAISDAVAIVGAYADDDNGDVTGSAYLFDTRTGAQIAKLLADDGAAGDVFGVSVAISGETAIVGALGDDDNGERAGSAYVYGFGCPADLNGDGAVNTQDFLEFLNLWAAGDPAADWDGDGTVNTVDFLAYLNDWAAGC